MIDLPKRKPIRIENYDYSTPGAYFITVCTANREKILWNGVGADIIRPRNVPLSIAGKIVEQGILQVAEHYENVAIDKYCIMPDHIHMILRIESDFDGRMISAPTINIVGAVINRPLSFGIPNKSSHTSQTQKHRTRFIVNIFAPMPRTKPSACDNLRPSIFLQNQKSVCFFSTRFLSFYLVCYLGNMRRYTRHCGIFISRNTPLVSAE